MSRVEYPIVIEPLSEADGGGYIARVPDLPGCFSDGETPEEAAVNVQDAIQVWIEAARDLGHDIPAPSRPDHAEFDFSARTDSAVGGRRAAG